MAECAGVLEEMLQAVEQDRVVGFSLMDNRRSTEMRNSQLSDAGGIDENQPRYLQNYISKKT